SGSAEAAVWCLSWQHVQYAVNADNGTTPTPGNYPVCGYRHVSAWRGCSANDKSGMWRIVLKVAEGMNVTVGLASRRALAGRTATSPSSANRATLNRGGYRY